MSVSTDSKPEEKQSETQTKAKEKISIFSLGDIVTWVNEQISADNTAEIEVDKKNRARWKGAKDAVCIMGYPFVTKRKQNFPPPNEDKVMREWLEPLAGILPGEAEFIVLCDMPEYQGIAVVRDDVYSRER